MQSDRTDSVISAFERACFAPVHASSPIVEQACEDGQVASNVTSGAYASYLKLAQLISFFDRGRPDPICFKGQTMRSQ